MGGGEVEGLSGGDGGGFCLKVNGDVGNAVKGRKNVFDAGGAVLAHHAFDGDDDLLGGCFFLKKHIGFSFLIYDIVVIVCIFVVFIIEFWAEGLEAKGVENDEDG